MTFVLFIGVLVAPWVAGLFGASSDTVERRDPAPLPRLGAAQLLETKTFAGLNDFVRDRTPLRGAATGWVNRGWLAVGASGDRTVMEGPDDYFFLAEDFTEVCAQGLELRALGGAVGQFQSAHKDVLFLVAPDKGAVLDYRLDGRAARAAECSRVHRPLFREGLGGTGISFDLAPALIEADMTEPDKWYYKHDSHWTFEGGGIAAEQIVEHFQPGLFDRSHIGTLQRALPINGDVYRRLGIERTLDVPDPVLASLRPNTATDRSEVQIGGTRTVRTYRNTGTDALIEGRTLVVHDSMMNFVERQLASYFEEMVFIHWDDLESAGFFGEVAQSDRVIMMRVERDVYHTIQNVLLDEEFAADFSAALATKPIERDELLPTELLTASEGMRAFTRDTGQFAQAFQDLLVDPGVDGWTGPYLTGEIFQSARHPRYGFWRSAQRSDSPPGTITECAEFNTGDCATWILLADVPLAIVNDLDRQFDGGDGLTAGRVRFTAGFDILYFYSLN